jgi:hypothetical protein
MIRSVVLACVVVCFFSFAGAAGPIALPPAPLSTLPLVRASNLVELGSFTTPSDVTGIWQGQTLYEFSYANGSIAFNPANQSLFVVGHDWGQHVAEISIPADGGTARVIQRFVDALSGKLALIDPDRETKKIGGLYVTGSTLLVSGYTYYDGAGNATASHFSRSTDLSNTGVVGPLRVGTLNPGFYGGYFAAIPAEWQASLGGDLIVGLTGIPIVSRTSYGPAAFAVKSADLVAGVNPTAAQPLVYYPQRNQTLGLYGQARTINPVYNATSQSRGVVIPLGTSTLLFFGSTGLGPYCYGQGTEDQNLGFQPIPNERGVVYCYDRSNSAKGEHAFPYSSYVWAYNLNDLAAVKAGKKRPWTVTPYATWELSGIGTVVGAAYDAATGRLFLSTPGPTLVVHVFKVT